MRQSGYLTTDPLQDNRGLNSGKWPGGGGGGGGRGGRDLKEVGSSWKVVNTK